MSINLEEKNNLYHTILDIIKQNADNQKAATQIILFFEQFLNDKQLEQEEKEADKAEGKISPIFKRM